MSSIEFIKKSKPKDLGDNFLVRRALPDFNKRMIGPFIFWDHMGPVTLIDDKQMKVRAHPHIGLATITWLFSGEIMHRDSLGNEQPIIPGEVNWMTAGKGIVHSERSYSKENQEVTLEGIQLWLALPKDKEDVAPSFFHCKQNDLSVWNANGISLTIIAGSGLGLKSPVPVYSNLFYFYGRAKVGSHFKMDLEALHEGAVYVVSGTLKMEGMYADKFSLVSFKKGTSIQLEAIEESEFMMFGGEVFPEERYIWWNFVSTEKDKIEKAKIDWKEGRFPKVINEDELTPLPEIS